MNYRKDRQISALQRDELQERQRDVAENGDDLQERKNTQCMLQNGKLRQITAKVMRKMVACYSKSNEQNGGMYVIVKVMRKMVACMLQYK